MFGDYETADFVAYICATIDHDCRRELRPRGKGMPGTIKSERDYVSALSTRIRDRLSLDFACIVETIDQGTEMKNGVDGIILFRFGDQVKIGWYEAKWPRVLQTDYLWDKVHPVRATSHFSEQILKQHRWKDSLALWEMFFNEAENGFDSPPYAHFGSSCVWHENAYDFVKDEGLLYDRWTTVKLKSLLERNCQNFYSVIFDIVSCKKGKIYKVAKDQRSIVIGNPRAENETISIPLPEEPKKIRPNILEEVDSARGYRIRSFMSANNIAGYLYIDLNDHLNE